MGKGNCYWKRDGDGRFMDMKEEGMGKGELKGGYNVEMGREKEFMVDFGVLENGRESVRLIGLENWFDEG